LPQIAKGVIGMVVGGHYPLNHHPARLAGEDLERQLLGWDTISHTCSVAQSLFFIWTSVAVSVVVSPPCPLSPCHLETLMLRILCETVYDVEKR